MKTKEEIEEVMNDSITVGECFGGAIQTEEDRELFLGIRRNIKDIVHNEGSVTVSAKRIFEEVFSMEFDEKQWYAMVILMIEFIELGKYIGTDKTLEYMCNMGRL